MNKSKAVLMTSKHSGFTIVELLVVIVVIGILAAITIVSYTGITQKAAIATLQSDLSNASNKLKIYQVTYGSYPTTLNPSYCPTAPNYDANLCLKPSPNNTFTTYTSNGTTFSLVETNVNGTIYDISDNTVASVYVDPWIADWYPGVAATILEGKHVYKTDASGTYEWTANSPAFTAGCTTGGRWPTLAELQAIYADRASYGTFQPTDYWSSDYYFSSYAYVVDFSDGGTHGGGIGGASDYVRCVAD